MRIQKPLTDKQLKDGDLVPKGTYDFMVVDALEKVSKKGAEMIELKLRIWLPDGRERIVFDYLLEALEYKVGHFAETVGMFEQYQRGDLHAFDCIGKSGQLKLTIQVDKTGQYGDKNSVVDYLPTDEANAKAMEAKVAEAKTQVDPNFNDDLPF